MLKCLPAILYMGSTDRLWVDADFMPDADVPECLSYTPGFTIAAARSSLMRFLTTLEDRYGEGVDGPQRTVGDIVAMSRVLLTSYGMTRMGNFSMWNSEHQARLRNLAAALGEVENLRPLQRAARIEALHAHAYALFGEVLVNLSEGRGIGLRSEIRARPN